MKLPRQRAFHWEIYALPIEKLWNFSGVLHFCLSRAVMYTVYNYIIQYIYTPGWVPNALRKQFGNPNRRAWSSYRWSLNMRKKHHIHREHDDGILFFPNIFRRTQMREIDSVWNAYQNIWHWCSRNLLNCQTVALCCYLCIQYIFLHKVECTSFSGITNQHNPTKTLKWENEQVQVNQIECKV